MKKILSIILALGLVLAMSVAALPTSAQVSVATVDVVEPCAGATAVYTVDFNVTGDLIIGQTQVWIEFPAGTVLPNFTTAPVTGTITLNTVAVPAAWITVDGLTVKFYSPEHVVVTDDPAVTVVMTGIKNPPAGTYNLWVNTSAPVDLTPVKSADYDIGPAKSAYKFVIDFDKEDVAPFNLPPFDATDIDNFYTGIGEGFIPPFQFCEYTALNLWLRYDGLVGCNPYDRTIIKVDLCDAPAGAVVTLWLYGWHTDGTDVVLDWHEFELEIDPLDPTASWFYWGFWDGDITTSGFTLAPDHNESTPGVIHFDTPGDPADYCICLTLIDLAPIPDVCDDPEDDEILISPDDAKFCAKVYQALDSYPVDAFGPKWNFFSSPLILKDGDIEEVLSPVIDSGQLKRVVHYDNKLDKWFAFHADSNYPGNMQSLTQIEDGKGYAVRMLATYEAGYDATAAPVLWMFGNEEPEFPAPPLSYKVYPGWTMLGFTSTTQMPTDDYLYPSIVTPGSVWHFGFDPADMDPGFGYWVYFNEAGFVVPGVTP